MPPLEGDGDRNRMTNEQVIPKMGCQPASSCGRSEKTAAKILAKKRGFFAKDAFTPI